MNRRAAPIADTALEHAQWRDVFSQVCATFSVSQVIVSSLIGHALDAARQRPADRDRMPRLLPAMASAACRLR
ncbi:MAG: hypothetical protein IPH76_16770 [Xanthomonadales bacterium]|nr:hypothetical protein [Xanthomonadales bacterium]